MIGMSEKYFTFLGSDWPTSFIVRCFKGRLTHSSLTAAAGTFLTGVTDLQNKALFLNGGAKPKCLTVIKVIRKSARPFGYEFRSHVGVPQPR